MTCGLYLHIRHCCCIWATSQAMHNEGTVIQHFHPQLWRRHLLYRIRHYSSIESTKNCIQTQVGATPEGTETPKCTIDPTSIAAIQSQPAEHRARIPQGADPKWRYMWRIGDRPAETHYAELNAEPVIPAGALCPCILAYCPVLKTTHCTTMWLHAPRNNFQSMILGDPPDAMQTFLNGLR